MITSMKTLIILILTGGILVQGSLFHPSNGYDYSQRSSRPTGYTVNVPLYQRIAAALSGLNSNTAHHESTGCVLDHLQDPDQGEVVQSAAYPHVTLYNPNYQQSQLNPVVYNPAVAYNQAVSYNQPVGFNVPVAYPPAVVVNRIRAVQRVALRYPIPALPLEGVSPVDYGHHQSFY